MNHGREDEELVASAAVEERDAAGGGGCMVTQKEAQRHFQSFELKDLSAEAQA